MGTTGTVFNGRIELDDPGFFPEGAKIRIVRWEVVELSSEDDADECYPVPLPDETFEEHLAVLRQSVADGQAGLGIPLHEAMAMLQAEIEAMPGESAK